MTYLNLNTYSLKIINYFWNQSLKKWNKRERKFTVFIGPIVYVWMSAYQTAILCFSSDHLTVDSCWILMLETLPLFPFILVELFFPINFTSCLFVCLFVSLMLSFVFQSWTSLFLSINSLIFWMILKVEIKNVWSEINLTFYSTSNMH